MLTRRGGPDCILGGVPPYLPFYCTKPGGAERTARKPWARPGCAGRAARGGARRGGGQHSGGRPGRAACRRAGGGRRAPARARGRRHGAAGHAGRHHHARQARLRRPRAGARRGRRPGRGAPKSPGILAAAAGGDPVGHCSSDGSGGSICRNASCARCSTRMCRGWRVALRLARDSLQPPAFWRENADGCTMSRRSRTRRAARAGRLGQTRLVRPATERSLAETAQSQTPSLLCSGYDRSVLTACECV